jgi:photosystem II stability/assembly factor-like uncharacterized protein
MTWTRRPSGTTQWLRSISCSGATNCLAVGFSGTILTSTDSGATWRSLTSGTSTDLFGVACPNSSTCVAVGSGGAILTSVDGGATWTSRISGTTTDLFRVTCPSSSHCLAVGGSIATGQGGTIMASTDGGVTWTSQASVPTNELEGISCPSVTRCLAVGAQGMILVSTDGGGTWISRTSGTPDLLDGISCPSVTYCLAVGNYGTILVSADGGATWSDQTWGSQTMGSAHTLYSIACPSASDCLAVGDDGAIVTSVRGATWRSENSGTADLLLGISCPSANYCVVVGEAGTILTSRGSPPPISASSHRPSTRTSMHSPSTAIVFLQGVCSSIPGGPGSADAAFAPLRKKLIAGYGYTANQFLDYSYAGGKMKEKDGVWVWDPKSYGTMAPISQDYQTTSWAALDTMLRDYHAHHPKTKFILVGHSLGGVVAFEELVKHHGMYGSLAKVVTIDSPLHGITHAVYTSSTLLAGRGIPPCAITGPASAELAGEHQLQPSTLRKVVATAQAHHIQVITTGNQRDGLLQPNICSIPVDGDINSQWVGGATIIKFDLQKLISFKWDCVNDTHSAALTDPSAIDELAKVINVKAVVAVHVAPILEPALSNLRRVAVPVYLPSWMPRFKVKAYLRTTVYAGGGYSVFVGDVPGGGPHASELWAMYASPEGVQGPLPPDAQQIDMGGLGGKAYLTQNRASNIGPSIIWDKSGYRYEVEDPRAVVPADQIGSGMGTLIKIARSLVRLK